MAGPAGGSGGYLAPMGSCGHEELEPTAPRTSNFKDRRHGMAREGDKGDERGRRARPGGQWRVQRVQAP